MYMGHHASNLVRPPTKVQINLTSVQTTRIPRQFTASFNFFIARTRTVLDAGFALKTQGSLVNAFTPLRAGVAGFFFNFNASMPESLNEPCFFNSPDATNHHCLDCTLDFLGFQTRSLCDRLVHIGSSQNRGLHRCRWCHGDLAEICGRTSCPQPQTTKRPCPDGRSRKPAHHELMPMKCSSGQTRKTNALTRCAKTLPELCDSAKTLANHKDMDGKKCRTSAMHLELVWQTDNGAD